jgi:hypothetical protein
MTAVTTVRAPTGAARLLGVTARVWTLLAALFWGVLFFGLVDLQVVVVQNDVFYLHYVLEVGWGLLYTVLVMAPLLFWAVRPRLVVLPRCVLAVGAAVLLTGIAFGAVGQGAAGLALLVSAAPGFWMMRGEVHLRWSIGGLSAVVVGVGALGAAAYLVLLVAAVRSGRTDEDTWGLMHLPMQAALAVAVPACLATALLHAPAHGWRTGVVLPAVAAAGLGVTCAAYPDHLGSAGTAGGWAMVAWAVLVVVLTCRPSVSRSGEHGRSPASSG